jgi:PhnB protein
MMVSYDAADADDARRVYDALVEGGEATQDLQPTFFSVAFGMCVDQFGTPWMIVGPEPEAPST